MLKKSLILLTLILLVGCVPTPSIALFAGQDTVEIYTEWEDAGAGLDMQTYWIEPTDVVGEVDTNRLGTYEIRYYVDHNNETYSITRFVQVVDQTPPVLTLNPGLDSLKVGETWEDAGVQVVDNSLEEIEATVSHTIDTNTPGTYEVVYTAEDSSGNQATTTRYVTIFE